MGLFIETNFESEYSDYIVTIKPPSSLSESMFGNGPMVLSGVLVSNPINELSSSAEISTNITSGGIIEMIKGGFDKVIEKYGKSNFAKMLANNANDSATSLAATIKAWDRSLDTFSFTVSYIVFKTGKDGCSTCSSYKNLVNQVARLTRSNNSLNDPILKSYYIEYTKLESWINNLTSTVDEGNLINSSFTVNIGNWFSCNRLLPTSSNVEFSKYLSKDGSPQYARVSITFECYRALNADEFSEMIRY